MENGGEGKKGSRGDNDSGQASAGKIFVGGLSWETTTEKLTKHFKKYGEIIDSVVMRDRSTGHPRGFGFVTYSDSSVVDKVIKDSHLIDGRTVEIKRSVPRENMVKGPKTKKIFVGGLPLTTTEGEFKSYFAQFGTVVEHQIMHDHGSGRSRGFGFITFDNEQTVDDLLSQTKVLELGGKEIEVKKAEPKKAALEEPAGYGPPPRRDSYGYGGAGGYEGYDEGFGRYGSSLYNRTGGYGDGMYGSGFGGGEYGSSGYGGGGYGGGGYGGSSYGGGDYGGYGAGSVGGSYGGYGSSMLGQYGEADLYAGRGYGGYSGGYGSSGYGSTSGYGSSRSSGGGRYHPYGRN